MKNLGNNGLRPIEEEGEEAVVGQGTGEEITITSTFRLYIIYSYTEFTLLLNSHCIHALILFHIYTSCINVLIYIPSFMLKFTHSLHNGILKCHSC